MTLSFGAVGDSETSSTTITCTIPAGFTAGSLGVLQVVSGGTFDTIPTTPDGWTLAGTFEGGAGTFAMGAGPRRLTWFTQVLNAASVAPTSTITASTGSVIVGRVFTVTSTVAGIGFLVDSAFGEDTTSNTVFSAPCNPALSWAVGDLVITGYGLPLNTVTMSTENIAATGVTFGASQERADDAHSNGFTCRMGTASQSVTAGTVTALPTVTATLSAATSGVGGLLRLREVATTVEIIPEATFPPRNLISVTGLSSSGIASVSIVRQSDAGNVPVRASTHVDVTTTDVLLRVDGEQPFGVPVVYLVTLTDANGATRQISSQQITSTVDSDVISDAVRGIGAAVFLETPADKARDRGSTTFNVAGRLIVVGKPRSAPTLTFAVRTQTDGAGDDLNETLDGLTEGVLLVRRQTSTPRLDGYYALLSDTESPTWYDEFRWWSLDVSQTQAWPDTLEGGGYTLQDIANAYTPGTLADLANDFTPGTLLDVALHDWGN